MIDLKTEVCGYYKIEAFKADDNGAEIPGTRRVVADWFPNLITDNGLNLIGSSSDWLLYCQVGSGSTPPVNADTALASKITDTQAKSSNTAGAQSSAPYFFWRRNVYRFATGAAAGNISEVGVGASATGNLLSRALILDSGGSPTTITVLSDETLDVSYEFRYYAPTADWSGSVTLGSVSYSVTGRASNVATQSNSTGWNISTEGNSSAVGATTSCIAYNGTIGSIASLPSGTSGASSSASSSAYSAGSHVRDSTVEWALSSGNLSGGITAAAFKLGVGFYQFGFTPAIPKDSTKVLSLVVRHSWARRP